jgi:hypothetical protein
MIGESAGAAGKSAGTAGASNGGSDTGSGGSTSSHAGAAAGGASEMGGGPEMGGASNTAGASTGGSSMGGTSNHGGASSGGSSSGGASSGGAGGGGAVCMHDADCGAGFNCLYKIADACTAKGSCFKAPTGAVCASVSPYCGCTGQAVAVPCYEPNGYSPAPVTGPQTGQTCAPPPNPACAGKACGFPCGTGEVPSICDGKGDCVLGGACAA